MVSGGVHELCGCEVAGGAAEDEQAGCEVKIPRIFERKENKKLRQNKFQVGWRVNVRHEMIKYECKKRYSSSELGGGQGLLNPNCIRIQEEIYALTT